MSEWTLLLLLIAFLWLAESVLWLRHDSEAVVRTWKGFTSARRAANRGNLSSSLVWASTVPGGQDFLCGEWPVRLDPDALCIPVRGSALESSPEWERLDWDTIESVDRWSNTITLNETREIRFGTVTMARELGRLIVCCRNAAPENRPQIIDEAMRGAFDDDAIEAEWQRFRHVSRVPGVLAAVLFVTVFVALPALAIWLGASNIGMEMLGVVLLLDLLVAAAFVIGHRALVPFDRFGRWTTALTMLVSPATAMNATRHLARPLFGRFHPVPVVTRLASFDHAARFVRSRWWNGDEPDPWKPYLDAWLERHDELRERFSLVPQRESRSETYCPRCEIQYVITAGICNDCRIGLVPFES